MLSTTNDIEASFSLHHDVIAVEAEKDVLQDAEDCLRLYSQNCDTDGQTIVQRCNDFCKRKAQQQLQSGDVTPVESVVKSLNATENIRTWQQSSQQLDLEQYLRRQDELAQKKCHLKRKLGDISSDSKRSEIFIKQFKSDQPQSHDSQTKSNLRYKRRCKGDARIGLTKIDHICHSASVITKRSGSVRNIVQNESESEYIPSDDTNDSDEELPKRLSKKKTFHAKSKSMHRSRVLDDGDENIYRNRMRMTSASFSQKSHCVNGLLKVPSSIWNKLYSYQKVAVRWLWELHNRCLGGLLGDEMGLGKTVEVIAFLAALDHSELLSDGERFRGLGPTLIICPATLMEQWVEHFHYWWPTLRVTILHRSGTYNGSPDNLIDSLRSGGVLITTYSGILGHKDSLLNMQWHYVILDEGHKIRNPRAKITKTVKEFSTPHRLLLTGSPMQNSLAELWSLFDFVLPGKLGTLPAFLEHCATPITRAGYSNATPLQQATALQVATMLKDSITPYMLRRTKGDVKLHLNLPDKNEQVLFCTLTEEQRELYKSYLRSDDVSFVLHEKRHRQGKGMYRARVLVALSALRKICNHPDLFLHTIGSDDFNNGDDGSSDSDVGAMTKNLLENFGHWQRAGKTTVVRSLLRIWKSQGHRVLLFTQGRQMMHILESLLQREQYSYLRMDGTSSMSRRQETIRNFNNDSSYFIFLLTTRVGGLGVNLIGANRVVIYDPDWNPATDCQARERAWRIGQNKSVTVYRLITAGTIEEKIYHRQVFKMLLSNKVLEDPRQSKLIKMSDLTELLHLSEPQDGNDQSSETDKLFPRARLTPSTIRTAALSSKKLERMQQMATVLDKGKVRNIHRAQSSVTTGEEVNESVSFIESRSQRDRSKLKQRLVATSPESIDDVAAVFEGERVSCLLGRRIAQRSSDKSSSLVPLSLISSSSSSLSQSITDDNYVLNKLFANAGVKSAFQHDAILSNLHKVDTDDVSPTERMARETARQNMNSLKKSRQWCKPVWMGTSSTKH